MNQPRARISDTGIQPIGKFAVMRHNFRLKSARFACLRDTMPSALEEAERLTVKMVQERGATSDFCFYVVEIVGRAGIVDGRLTSELKSR